MFGLVVVTSVVEAVVSVVGVGAVVVIVVVVVAATVVVADACALQCSNSSVKLDFCDATTMVDMTNANRAIEINVINLLLKIHARTEQELRVNKLITMLMTTKTTTASSKPQS